MVRPLMARGLALLFLLTACASATPRFSQELATSFAREDMQRLATPELEVYYPKAYRGAALSLAARSAECLRTYRVREPVQRSRDKALLFITSANYNNAYVSGQFQGEPLHSVNPLFVTDELFHWYGLGNTEAGDISCHEMFHFAHFEQLEGLWRLVNAVFGPIAPSQAFIDRWFTEGVAQFYEGRIHRNVGRPWSPVYRGAFESIVDLREGRLGAGDLGLLQRELLPYTGAYLASLPFVEWLAQTYGEDKLWQLIDLQGRAIFTPLGVTLRFSAVYDRDIGDLLEEFSAHLVKTRAHRTRPAGQRVLRADVGQLVRVASHPASGTIAVLTSGLEEGPRLRILERDGRVRVERTLVRLTTGREWVFAGPSSMSGLSFTANGRWLYLFNDDLTLVGDTRGQLWRVDAQTGEVLKVWQDIGYGLGGAVHPDGSAYTYVRSAPGRSSFVDVDLETGKETTLLEIDGRSSAAPAWSPNGKRLVFSRLDPEGWNLLLREPDGAVRELTTDGAFDYAAHFEDETHVVFARTFDGRLQAHRLDVDSGELSVLTDAPWTMLDPAPLGDQVVFANRDGAGFSLDVAPAVARKVLRAGTVAAQAERTARHEPAPLVVESDGDYTSLDHLFYPQLRAPGVLLSSTAGGGLLASTYLSLMGRDRLGFHTWAINAMLGVPSGDTDLELSYLNMRLAPWALQAYGDRYQTSQETLWTSFVSALRAVSIAQVGLGLNGIVRQLMDDPDRSPGVPALQRFIGPQASISWSAGESTPYGGTQRAVALSASAAAYPKGLGSSANLLDLAAGLSLAVPPPFLRRHSLVFGLTGRALPGAPDDVLRVGGDQSSVLWINDTGGDPNPTRSPGLTFPGSLRVPVRGYEDQAVRASMVATGSARYRYNFIIDRGFASTLWLFPSIFFRQVDLTLFGNATLTNTNGGTWMRAAGAQVALRVAFLSAAPISLVYQFAWRFDLGLPPLHVVALTTE